MLSDGLDVYSGVVHVLFVKPIAHQCDLIAIWSDVTELSLSGLCSVPIHSI